MKKKGKTYILTETQYRGLMEAKEMTEYKFMSNIKNFIANLFDDPVNAVVPDIFKLNGFKERGNLLKPLLKNKILKKTERLCDKDENGNPKTVTMMIKYEFPDDIKKNKSKIKHRLNKMYIELFENIHARDYYMLNEQDGGATSANVSADGAYDAPAFLDDDTSDRTPGNVCGMHNKLEETIDNRKPTVYLMCGMPGAGKSTYIKKHLGNIPIVSRDMIRVKIGMAKDTDDKVAGNKEQEEMVTEIEYNMINDLCIAGKNFVIDDTNTGRFRKQLINMLRKYDINIVAININTPLETCIKRRNGQIPVEIMKNIYNNMSFINGGEDDEDVNEVIWVKN